MSLSAERTEMTFVGADSRVPKETPLDGAHVGAT